MRRPILVKQVEPEVPTEILAEAIVSISASIKKLREGPLNDKALMLLIQHATPRGRNVTIRDIETVLIGMGSLEATYINKPKGR